MNEIKVYEGIMTPIEMLSNSNRLPTVTSPIYEPNLVASMIMHSNGTPNYTEYLENWINNVYKTSSEIIDIPPFEISQLEDLLTEPIPVCQFHVIEVMLFSENF